MWTVFPILQELEREIKVNGQTGEGDIYLRFFEGKGTERGLKQAMRAHTHTQHDGGPVTENTVHQHFLPVNQ